jgi:glycerol uptake facilitator-like aquaporin
MVPRWLGLECSLSSLCEQPSAAHFLLLLLFLASSTVLSYISFILNLIFMFENWKKYLAESIATASLSLAVIATIAAKPDFTPFAAALTLGLFVYTIGTISGAHLNPAVSLGALVLNKLSWKDAIGYIVSQIIGGFFALVLASFFVENLSEILETATSTDASVIGITFAEMIGTFFLGFGVASVVFKKTPEMMNGIVIGGSLLLGIFIASSLGAPGILNPAVAIATGSLNVGLIIGPILGAMGGMWLYKMLSK